MSKEDTKDIYVVTVTLYAQEAITSYNCPIEIYGEIYRNWRKGELDAIKIIGYELSLALYNLDQVVLGKKSAKSEIILSS